MTRDLAFLSSIEIQANLNKVNDDTNISSNNNHNLNSTTNETL